MSKSIRFFKPSGNILQLTLSWQGLSFVCLQSKKKTEHSRFLKCSTHSWNKNRMTKVRRKRTDLIIIGRLWAGGWGRGTPRRCRGRGSPRSRITGTGRVSSRISGAAIVGRGAPTRRLAARIVVLGAGAAAVAVRTRRSWAVTPAWIRAWIITLLSV